MMSMEEEDKIKKRKKGKKSSFPLASHLFEEDRIKKIFREFSTIEQTEKQNPLEIDENSLTPVNAEKNRYTDVLPLKKTVVKLDEVEGIEGSDYINANFVRDNGSADKNQLYICCQAPLTSTVSDFWRMVWMYRVPVIVMITNLIEKNCIKADLYWPSRVDKVVRFGDYCVQLVSEKQETDNSVVMRTCKMWQYQPPQNNKNNNNDNNNINNNQQNTDKNNSNSPMKSPTSKLSNKELKSRMRSASHSKSKRRNSDSFQDQSDDANNSTSQNDDDANEDGSQPSTPVSQTKLQLLTKNTSNPTTTTTTTTTTTSTTDNNQTEKTSSNTQNKDDDRNHKNINSSNNINKKDKFNILMSIKESPKVTSKNPSEKAATSSSTTSSTKKSLSGKNLASKFSYHSSREEDTTEDNLMSDHDDDYDHDEDDDDDDDDDSSEQDLSPIDGQEVREIIQIQCTEWPDNGVPKSTQVMKDLIVNVDNCKKSIDQPIVVHCSAGIGRTGAFVAVHSCIQKHLNGEPFDIKESVRTIRTQRKGMIKSKEQYMFVYAVIADMILEHGQRTNTPTTIDFLTKNPKLLTDFKSSNRIRNLTSNSSKRRKEIKVSTTTTSSLSTSSSSSIAASSSYSVSTTSRQSQFLENSDNSESDNSNSD
eukprot:TRINITY_DN2407_c0_g2_i1.p1 TRINITY_DN2407_c0_g2~~TRINITY_DN2407_c0_g2_i1.p1  ORF type:complete len:647 (-),score=204.38 TRINITY_DN2407_c0_g2_i1:1509-3449(-)